MTLREKHVVLLMAKAAQDEYILDRLQNDPEAPAEVYGFHAQQAAEKLLKAILSHAGVEYPRTHQLAGLLDLATDNAVPIPADFEDLRYLSPYAVEFRYDVLPGEEQESLDKTAVRQQIAALRTWTEQRVAIQEGQ